MSTQPPITPYVLPPELEVESDLDLRRWLVAVRRRLWLVAAIVGGALAVALLLWAVTPREYRATAVIQLEPPPLPTATADGEERDVTWYFPTQYRLLASRGLAEKVVARLGLAHDPDFAVRSAAGGPAATRAGHEEVLGGLANRLLASLQVAPVHQTRLVEISYRARSPRLAADVANAVAASYIAWGSESRAAPSATVGGAAAAQVAGPVAVVVERALVPSEPFRPSLPRNLGFGLAAGLLLAVGVVAVLELLDRTLRTPDDVDQVLGLPVLGVVPDISHGNGRSASAPRIELVPHEHPRLAVSEAYRGIRTALLLSTAAGGLRSLVVTSAGAGEGKTATATNLAVTLAQLDRDVLLVDADLRKPSLHQVLRLPNRTGLASYLSGDADPLALFQRTAVPHLFATPSGPLPPNPAELLASPAMNEFLALACSRFDFVLLDSPPVLPVTDPTLLAALVDGVVVTAAAGRVRRDDAVAAVERMAVGDARVVGVVVNLFRQEQSGPARVVPYAAYGSFDPPGAAEEPSGEVTVFSPK